MALPPAPSPPLIVPAGDRALVVEFGRTVNVALNARVRAAAEHLLARRIPGVTDVVPAYAALTLHFDPTAVAAHYRTRNPMEAMCDAVARALERAPAVPRHPARTVEIPVCYGGEHGADLDEVAQRAGLTPDDVVRLHTAPLYDVYLLGFMPGFAYLGGLDRRIATPRRDVPRKRVLAGSVGIGGEQTGVYPLDSPGGWNIIGRTPLVLFRASREQPCTIAAGDRVRFVPIGAREYESLRGHG
jgi:inhibitor of KinA